jgi:hypothetical protein
LFPIWLGIGAIIYILYGFVTNRLNENKLYKEVVELKKQEMKR